MLKHKKPLLIASGVLGLLTQVSGDFSIVPCLIFAVILFAVFYSVSAKTDVNENIMLVLSMGGTFILCGMVGGLLHFA